MILQRISKALRKQDWFTVVIETLIVVFGVFIGLQVNNWNDGRAFAQLERDYLVQLKDEVAQNQRVTDYQINYVKAVVEAGKRALDFLESDEACTDDCAALLVDFFHASQLWGTPRTVTIFNEMERLGLPRGIETREALRQLYRFLDGWEFVNLSAPAYREHVRGYFSPTASEAMWRKCYSIPDDELEELTYDCIDDLKNMDTSSMLQRIRQSPDLGNQLRFWIGQNSFATHELPDARRFAAAAIELIDKELEK